MSEWQMDFYAKMFQPLKWSQNAYPPKQSTIKRYRSKQKWAWYKMPLGKVHTVCSWNLCFAVSIECHITMETSQRSIGNGAWRKYCSQCGGLLSHLTSPYVLLDTPHIPTSKGPVYCPIRSKLLGTIIWMLIINPLASYNKLQCLCWKWICSLTAHVGSYDKTYHLQLIQCHFLRSQ